MPTRTARTLRSVRDALDSPLLRWVSGVAVAVLIALLFVSFHNTDNFVRGCERGKSDRAAQAKGAQAQADYLTKVLDAKSVKQDVKKAATKAWEGWNDAAVDLRSRTGKNLDCNAEFPPLIPFVK